MNKDLFIKQFSRIAWQSKKPRSQEEIDASMDELWADDPFATVKLIMMSAARSRKQCPLRLGKGVAKVDVMGFYSMKEGLGMLYWLAVKHPEVFYQNLGQMGAIFGGWKMLVALWEYDLRKAKLNVENCQVRQYRIYGMMSKAFLDILYSTDATKAMPSIKRIGKSHTEHRIARNIIGKYIRSKLPKTEGLTSNRAYRNLKSSNKGKRIVYSQVNFKGYIALGMEKLFDMMMGQKCLKYVNLTGIEGYEEYKKSLDNGKRESKGGQKAAGTPLRGNRKRIVQKVGSYRPTGIENGKRPYKPVQAKREKCGGSDVRDRV